MRNKSCLLLIWALAFADPENSLSFAYTMNQMEVGALPGPKSIGLIQRLYQL
jgi:hypothetical protein